MSFPMVKIPDLRKELAFHGLSPIGDKDELVLRLVEALKANSGNKASNSSSDHKSGGDDIDDDIVVHATSEKGDDDDIGLAKQV